MLILTNVKVGPTAPPRSKYTHIVCSILLWPCLWPTILEMKTQPVYLICVYRGILSKSVKPFMRHWVSKVW